MKLQLFAILILAFSLRIYNLQAFPSGFTPDEASFGYDAYSIIKTGRDQWGKVLPIVLESHGDFKMPLYTYLTIPTVFLFGLNEFAVRLPNAIVGTLAVYAAYLLAKKIRQLSNLESRILNLELVAAFMLAISPWHFPLSRGAFEANLTTFLLPLGIYLFLIAKKKNWALPLSIFMFSLNIFSYHSARLVTTVVVVLLLILFFKEIEKVKTKYKIYSFIITMVTVFLTILSYSQGAGARASDISVLSGAGEAAAMPRLNAINSGANPAFAKLIHNKFTVSIKRFSNNYLQYFSPKFLLTKGPAEATYGMIPGHGVLLYLEFLGLLLSIIFIIKNPNKYIIFIFMCLFVAPIPAALTQGTGYAANRSAAMLPFIQLLSAYGIYHISKNKYLNYLLITVLIIQAFLFSKNYFNESGLDQQKISKSMLYGNLEILKDLPADEEVIISTSISEPQIYVAFAKKISPIDYQNSTKNWDYQKHNIKFLDQLPEYKLNNYTFKKIDWEKDQFENKIFIGKPEEFQTNANVTQKINIPETNTPVLYKVRPTLQ
jgi:4-amino-4-deoxy-L-arabinose transferase-like glycosyltransferase